MNNISEQNSIMCPPGHYFSYRERRCIPFSIGNSQQSLENEIPKENEQQPLWHNDEEFNNGIVPPPNTPTNTNQPTISKTKKFTNVGISAFDAVGALNYGLSAFANSVEEGRQKAWNQKQMVGNFNGTFSNAQNDYGVDPYEQTGQLRPYLKHGGKFNPIEFLYGDDEETQSLKNEEASTKKKQAPRITDEDVDNLSSLGFSPEDILNSPNSYRNYQGQSSGSLIDNIAQGESGNNYFIGNPQKGQSAYGKYQFTNAAQKDSYEATGGKNKYGSFEVYQKLFKTMPEVQEQAMSSRMQQAQKVVGNDPVALALYHYAPKFGLMYKQGKLDLDKNPASYGIGKGVSNPSFRNYLKTHGFKNQFEQGGELLQYPDGGPKPKKKPNTPIYITNPNDPRLKAYSDSLLIHNTLEQSAGLFKNKIEPLLKSNNEREAADIWNRVVKGFPKAANAAWNRLEKMNNKPLTTKMNESPTDKMFGYTTFKKPVQPVIYQKQKSNGTNKPKGARLGNDPVSGKKIWLFDAYQPPEKGYPQGRNWKEYVEPKPQERVDYPIVPRPAKPYGKATIHAPQQVQIPLPQGTPVYGPNGMLIGMNNNGQFTAVDGSPAKYNPNNQADLEAAKTKLKKGGVKNLPKIFQKGGTFNLNENEVQALIKMGYKIERL